MKKEFDRRLPYWPAAMNKQMAAAYCGLSSDTFDQLCPVKPIAFTDSARGKRFLRQRLDEWLLSLDPNPSIEEAVHKAREENPQTYSYWDEVKTYTPRSRKGLGGYTIVDDPNHALSVWYKKLGFDPHTMNEADMKRLIQEADDNWAAAVPGKPLYKREITALQEFAKHGANHKIDARDLKYCGPDTEDRLKARGFIQTFPHEKFPDQAGSYMLTDAGYEAWTAYQRDLPA